MASDRLFFVMQAAIELQKSNRLAPIKFVWQTLPWPTLALIQEDSSNGWVASIQASIEMPIQP
jgi:hypothetical protein